METRLIDLEMKFSHQDLEVERLQKTVFEQHLRIEKLEKQLELLKDRVKASASDGTTPGLPHEKPPHY